MVDHAVSDGLYIVTAVDYRGDREIREFFDRRAEAERYLRTVPRDKMPELWRREEGIKNENQAQG